MDVVNLAEKFSQFSDYWSPKTIADVNEMQVKLVKLKRVYDPSDRLAALSREAKSRFAEYRASEDERRRLTYWLTTAREKIIAALAVGDHLKTSLMATTSTWQIFEGLWAANDKPVPPVGAIMAHLPDLALAPDDLESLIQKLLVGQSQSRSTTAVALMGWIVDRL